MFDDITTLKKRVIVLSARRSSLKRLKKIERGNQLKSIESVISRLKGWIKEIDTAAPVGNKYKSSNLMPDVINNLVRKKIYELINKGQATSIDDLDKILSTPREEIREHLEILIDSNLILN